MKKRLLRSLQSIKRDRKSMTYLALAKKWRTSETTIFMLLNPSACRRQAKRLVAFKLAHPERVRKQGREGTRRYRERHPERTMLYNAKYRAKQDGVRFSITEKDVPIPKFCPILGIVLEVQRGVHRNNSPSIDRVNPKLGYVKGNVHVISHRANYIKNNETDPEVFEAIAMYLRHQKRKP